MVTDSKPILKAQSCAFCNMLFILLQPKQSACHSYPYCDPRPPWDLSYYVTCLCYVIMAAVLTCSIEGGLIHEILMGFYPNSSTSLSCMHSQTLWYEMGAFQTLVKYYTTDNLGQQKNDLFMPYCLQQIRLTVKFIKYKVELTQRLLAFFNNCSSPINLSTIRPIYQP